MNKDCAIFIAARDNYSDTWNIFFPLFFKYWQDCPYPIYLVSERKSYPDDRVINMNIADDPKMPWGKQWAGRMKQALEKIGTPYLIFFHTDYLLTDKVDTGRIRKLINILKDENENIGYIRLNPSPAPKMEYPKNKMLGVISKTDDYAISMQTTLWKTKFFEKFLVDGRNPVDLEMSGGKFSANMPEIFLSVKKGEPAISYLNGIKKGIWSYESVRFMKGEKINELLLRGVESFKDYFLKVTGIRSFFQRAGRITPSKLYYFLKSSFN